MDRFTTLEPVKLYASAATSTFLSRGNQRQVVIPLIGRLPENVYLSVLNYLTLPDIPAFSRVSRRFSEFARNESFWETKWKDLGIERDDLERTVDELESRLKEKTSPTSLPPKQASSLLDDDFGDFTSGMAGQTQTQSLFGAFQGASLSSHPAVLLGSSQHTYRQKFIRIFSILKPLLPCLSSLPHLILSSLFPLPSPSLIQQSHTLHLLTLFLSPPVKPVYNHQQLFASLRSAIDRFQASLLTTFDVADGNKDEDGMRDAALASWEVWEGHIRGSTITVSNWEMGKVWIEKREIFYEDDEWRPTDNFTYALKMLSRCFNFSERFKLGKMVNSISMQWINSWNMFSEFLMYMGQLQSMFSLLRRMLSFLSLSD